MANLIVECLRESPCEPIVGERTIHMFHTLDTVLTKDIIHIPEVSHLEYRGFDVFSERPEEANPPIFDIQNIGDLNARVLADAAARTVT